MTPLRRKMIEEFQIRQYAPGTQKSYLSCVAKFARHFGRSPDQLGPEEVRAFLLHLVNEAKVSHNVLVNYVSALRFLYKITLQRPWDLQLIPYPRREKHLPEIPTREEILHLLGCVRNLKHRADVANQSWSAPRATCGEHPPGRTGAGVRAPGIDAAVQRQFWGPLERDPSPSAGRHFIAFS